MKIATLNYNWYASAENGEEFSTYSVGQQIGDNTVSRIEEHRAQGEGDKWFYDIHLSDDSMIRVFNPNEVFFKQDNQ